VIDGDDGWACGLATGGLTDPATPALAVAAAAAWLDDDGAVELLMGATRGLVALAGAGPIGWPDRDDAPRWAAARARAAQLPMPGGSGVAGALALGQHVAGDPSWASRYRAAVATTAADDAIAALIAIDQRHRGLRRAARPAPAPQRRAARPPPARGRSPARSATTPAGIRLVVAREPEAATVAIRLVWSGGLAAETVETAGIHALAAAAITACADATVLDAFGGSLAVVVERDRFGLRAELPSATWRDGLAAIAACLRAPSASPDQLDDERRRLDGLALATRGSALRLGLAAFARAQFGDHPLARELAASAAPYLTPAAIDRWLAAHAPIDRAVLAVVGAVELEAVEAALAPVRPHPSASPPLPAAPPRLAPPRSHPESSPPRRGGPAPLLFVDADSAAVILGFPGLAADDPDRAALDVAAALLADPNGPLAALAPLAASRRVAVADTADAGYLAIAFDQPGDPAALTAAAESGLASLLTDPPSADAVLASRDRLLSARTVEPIRRRTWADDLALAALLGTPDRHAALASVDAAAVARVLRRVLAPATASTVIVRKPDITPGVRHQRAKPSSPRHRRARAR